MDNQIISTGDLHPKWSSTMKKTKTSLSIIIPVYNVERYLQQCIDSVLEQIDKEDEIILVNDGSTDRSREICLLYETEHENIMFLDRGHFGPGITRNIGLRKASGEHVVFLDADDFWAPNAATTIKNEILKKDVDVLFFDAEIICEGNIKFAGNPYDRAAVISGETISGLQFFEKYYPKGYISQACMAVYNKNYLLNHHIFFQEGVYYEDNIFCFCAMINAEKVRHIPDKLYQRRVRDNSITTSDIDFRRVSDYAKVVIEIWSYIRQRWDMPGTRIPIKVIAYADELLDIFFIKCRQVTEEKSMLWQVKTQVFTEYLLFINQYEEKRLERKLLTLGFYIKARPLMEKQYLIKEVFGGPEGFEKLIYSCLANYQARIKERLLKLPMFRTNCRVGIYGLGNQTEHLMLFCEKVGIAAEYIIFIDSYKKSDEETYRGHTVKNIRDVGNSVDAVIISSSLYGEEMNRTAQEFLPSSVKTILLYEECEDEILWEALI